MVIEIFGKYVFSKKALRFNRESVKFIAISINIS